MPLDRTWYNSLIDDDGSGMTGSVWDKADVDSLMDAVDAELARIQQGRTLATPAVQTSAGGTLAATVTFHYTILGDQLFYRFMLASISNPSSVPYLRLYPLPQFPIFNGDENMIRVFLSTSEWGYAVSNTAGFLELRRQGDAAFGAGTYFINGSGFYFIR